MEIKEFSDEAKYSTRLVQALHKVKNQYSTLQIEYLKNKIDQIMSSKPAVLEPESLKRNLEIMSQRIAVELNSLRGKQISKPLDIYSIQNKKPSHQHSSQPTVGQVITLPITPTPVSNHPSFEARLSSQSLQVNPPEKPNQTPSTIRPKPVPDTPASFQITPTNIGSQTQISTIQNEQTRVFTGPQQVSTTPTTTGEIAKTPDTVKPLATSFQILTAGIEKVSSRKELNPNNQGASFPPPPPPPAQSISTGATQITSFPESQQKIIISGKSSTSPLTKLDAGFSQAIRQVVSHASPGFHPLISQSSLSFGGPQTSATGAAIFQAKS